MLDSLSDAKLLEILGNGKQSLTMFKSLELLAMNLSETHPWDSNRISSMDSIATILSETLKLIEFIPWNS